MSNVSCSRNAAKTRGRLCAFAVASAVGLALFIGGGAANAQDNQHEPGSMPCTPIGQDGPPTIPEETIIKVGDDYYQCLRGQWWKLPRPKTAAQQGITVRPNVVSRASSLTMTP